VTPADRQGRLLAVEEVRRALGSVMDPELDEPITDLGFVRSVDVAADGAVEVHKGTFGAEAEQDLEELRVTFLRKAHVAAMERALTPLLRARSGMQESDLGTVTLCDLPEGPAKEALRHRRAALGLPDVPDALVMVDEDGRGYVPAEVPRRLRLARSTRISIDGNAHFCRGLLRTRYPGSGDDQTPRPDGAESCHQTFIPLTQLAHKEHS